MIEIWSSAIAVIVLLVLASTVILSRKARQAPLACAALLLAGIEVASRLSLHTDAEQSWHMVLVLESLLPCILLWYSFSFARREPLRPASLRGAAVLAAALLFPSAALFFPTDGFVYAPDYQTERMLFLGSTGYWFTIGLMLSCIAALVNIEATLSSSSGSDRWKIKFEAVGMAAVLAVLIFYFSQGLLYRSINANLLPIRSGVFILASCMILASKLLRGNGVRIAVSRTVYYRSVSVLAVGVYLVMLGLAGNGMHYLDVPFGRSFAIFLAFTGAIALLLALLSERLRRRVKVFISKHFFAHKHDYRQTWLDLTGRLSSCTTGPELEEAVIEVYRDIFGLGRASFYRLESVTGSYLSTADPGSVSPFKPSRALLSYFRDRSRVWNPSDGEYLPSEEELQFIHAKGARLVVPLMLNGDVEGLLVFGVQPEGDGFNYEDYDLMKIIARQSALLLSNLRLSDELIETRELAAVARVSSFVIHDLKNLTNALSLTIENAREHIGNPDFQEDLMTTIRQTVGNMKKLTQKLKVIPNNGLPSPEHHDLYRLAESVVRDFQRSRPDAAIVCRGDAVSCSADAEELRRVIINLIQNGIEAGDGRGAVTVETGMNRGAAVLRVADSGCGMPPEFLQRDLFRPFRSTKKSGLGIGLYQCKQIVVSLGGRIAVTSEIGKGTTFTVTFPADKAGCTLTRVP